MRIAILIGSLALLLVAAPGASTRSAEPASASKKRCKFVTKTIRGKKRRVRVCRNVAPPKRPPAPRPQPPPAPPSPPALPAAGRVTARVRLPADAGTLAYAEGAVWVVLSDNRVVRVDPATGQVREVLRVESAEWPPTIAAGEGAVWVAIAGPNTLVRIDPATGGALATIPVGHSPEGMAFTAGAVWVANHRSDAPDPRREPATDTAGTFTVSRVDVSTNREVVKVPVEVRQHALPWMRFCCGPARMAAGAGAVWVGSGFLRAVTRVDPATNTAIATIPIPTGDSCGGMAADDAAVWIASGCDIRIVSRIDPRTNAVVASIDVGESAGSVALGFGSVWATHRFNPVDNRASGLARIDPARNTVVARLPLSPAGSVTVGGGALWVGAGSELLHIEPS